MASVARVLLAFETVTRSASACVVADDGTLVERRDLGGGEAEVGLVSMLDALLRAHGRPRALAVAAGPGSFTGLRVGIVAARTLAWIEDLPVHPVDSLAAIAAGHGDGLWWALLPLKRDTTFHGLYRVRGRSVETVAAPAPVADAATPQLHASTAQAVAVGPALAQKPGLAQRWCPDVALGDAGAPDALGVALAASMADAVPWSRLLPDYGMAPAPVIQRGG